MHEKQDGSFATVVTAGDQGTQTVYFEVFMANDSEHAPDRVKFEGWRVTVAPDGDRDISIRLNPTPDCEASGAICTPEGGALESGLTRSVRGPTKVSVADAQVEEADGAMLEFEVSLSRTLDEAFTVAYATSDGSARSGEDYRDSAGALTFAPGTMRQSISVPVIDDAHDEGSETLQLTLSNPNPSRVKLARATATGTINNSDPMPPGVGGAPRQNHFEPGRGRTRKSPSPAGVLEFCSPGSIPSLAPPTVRCVSSAPSRNALRRGPAQH